MDSRRYVKHNWKFCLLRLSLSILPALRPLLGSFWRRSLPGPVPLGWFWAAEVVDLKRFSVSAALSPIVAKPI